MKLLLHFLWQMMPPSSINMVKFQFISITLCSSFSLSLPTASTKKLILKLLQCEKICAIHVFDTIENIRFKWYTTKFQWWYIGLSPIRTTATTIKCQPVHLEERDMWKMKPCLWLSHTMRVSFVLKCVLIILRFVLVWAKRWHKTHQYLGLLGLDFF